MQPCIQQRYQGPWQFLVHHIRLFHFAPRPSVAVCSLHLSALCKSYTDCAVRNLYRASRSFNCYRQCKEGYLIKCSLICYSAELEILSNIHLEIKDEMISSWK